MGTSYPKDTLISLANSEKRKLQYRLRTYYPLCTVNPWCIIPPPFRPKREEERSSKKARRYDKCIKALKVAENGPKMHI
jgi:hypothetical protein